MAAGTDSILLASEDISYEEDVLRNPHSLKHWWWYLEFKARAPTKIRFRIYERAVKSLPRSYKLWFKYLTERVHECKNLSLEDSSFEATNAAFERALVTMHKMPRIWLDYLKFLIVQKSVTKIRRTFDRALRTLPITQHNRVWPLYLRFVQFARIPELAVRVYRRYLKMESDRAEEFVDYLKKIKSWDEAATQLANLVNNEKFVSQYGKSKYDLWKELLNIITKNPGSIKTLNVDAVIRSGIRRFPHQVGHLWCALAEYYVTDGRFAKAKDIYEEALNTVSTVRDFSVVFDAYSQYEESLLAAKMEIAESEGMEDDDENGDQGGSGIAELSASDEVDWRMMRLENLMERRKLLLNSVLLRQNPHNVDEWHKRVKLFKDQPIKAITTFSKAVATVDPSQATGKPHSLWVSFARFYEDHGELKNARVIFEKAARVAYKGVDDLASVWCAYAEMELRHRNYELARRVMRKACVAPDRLKSSYKDKDDESVEVQKRLYKSTKLWAFYADLEENLGTFDTTCSVYESLFDVKVISPQIVLNYAAYLEEHKHFEKAFRAYEKGLDLFNFPHAFPIWIAYLKRFIIRYKGDKKERARDLFEQAVGKITKVNARKMYLLYAKYEEDYGLSRRAMDILDRACKAVEVKERAAMYSIYISRVAKLFGVTKSREIYHEAIRNLPEKDLKPICLRYADLEKKLGEIDRARSIYAYTAQYCSPEKDRDFWDSWKEFEVSHGNEDTYTEMLRVRRSVIGQFATVQLLPTDVIAKTEDPKKKNQRKPVPVGDVIVEDKDGKASEEKANDSEAAKKPSKNQEEIEFDDEDDDDDIIDVQEKPVPAAVFGAAAVGGKNLGAKERFKRKQ
eukprot:jgi/Bigna1/38562/e_gw1.26.7.1